MANRRMFSLKVVDTDAFLDMPQTTQLLYFHLSMRADDDGFVSNPKKIMRMLGTHEDDIKILCTKRFVIPFESGVCVIKHWKIHNLIRLDRYTETQWIKEKEQLLFDEKTGKYSLNKGQEQLVIPDDNQSHTQVRVVKCSLGNNIYKGVEEELTQEVINSLSPSLLEKFKNHWNQEVKFQGQTMAYWQKERKKKAFDVNKRLATFKRNQDDWQREKNQRFIKDEEKPRRQTTPDGMSSMGELLN